MKRALHPISGRNCYCGPTAIATVLGITTDHASRLLREVSGNKVIRGVLTMHLDMALRLSGCQIERHTPPEVITAAEWIAQNRQRYLAQHVLLIFGGHVGVLLGDSYQCSLTLGQGGVVDLAAIPNRTGKVQAWIEVQSLPANPPVDSEHQQRRRCATQLRRARQLAARHGIVVESAEGVHTVYCPALLHDDPHEGQESTDSSEVVLGLVEDYIACLQNGYLDAVTDPRLISS